MLVEGSTLRIASSREPVPTLISDGVDSPALLAPALAIASIFSSGSSGLVGIA
jgi:hypothetical protein